jgi:AraC-like DNA-binding protein
MPLALYLFEIRNERQSFPASPSFALREMSSENMNRLSEACRKLGISICALHAHDSRIAYRSATYTLLESAIYCSSSPTGWSLDGDLAFDGYGLSIPRTGFARWHTEREVAENDPAGGTILDLAYLQKAVFSPGSECDGLFFSRDLLTRELSNLLDSPVLEQLRFSPKIPAGSHVLSSIRSIIDIIAHGLKHNAPLRKAPLALASLNQAAIYIILQKLPHNYSAILSHPQLPPAPRHIKHAIEFIHANLAKPITLKEIAASASISIRTLQSGFQKFREMSPMAYLKMQRLAATKRDLLNPHIHDDIERIAFSWGFTHFYLFKRNYQKVFGETPRMTLDKRKRQ